MAEDIATLALQIDSSSAKTAVDNLNQLGTASSKAEGEVNSLGKTWVKASSDAGRLRMASAQAATALDGVRVSVGAQRAGMQQLSYQIGDVAQQFALGVPAMRIFVQQGGQVVQALQLMGSGTSGLLRFLGGPWGIGIAAAATVLVPFISKLFETKDAADEAHDALQGMIDALNQSYAESNKFYDAQQSLNKLYVQRTGVLRDLATAQATLSTVARGGDQAYAAAAGRISNLQKQASDLTNRIAQGQSGLDLALNKVNKDFVEQATGADKATKSLRGHSTALGTHAIAISQDQKATDQALQTAQAYAANLEESTAQLGLDSDALKQREARLAANAALAAALKAPTQSLREQLIAEAGTIIADAKAWQQRNDELERHKAIEEALAVSLPKVGELSKQASDGLQKMDDEAQRLKKEGIDALNSSLDDLIHSLGRIEGFGGVIGALLGVASGNLGSIRGPIGDLLNLVTGTHTETINGETRVIADRLGDKLLSIFGGAGSPFAKTLTGALQDAGIGLTGGSLVAGSHYSMTEQAGGLLGGIGGSIAGSALAGSATAAFGAAIGSAVPIIGTIVGGMLGSLVGGLFGGGAKYGYAGSSGAGGNNSDAQSAASQLGDSVKSGLDSIAQALGLTVGSYNTSVGVTDGKYRYSTTGRTGELKSKYSDVTVTGTGDAGAAAAVTGAIRDAIKDGAIQGLSETEKAFLLKAGDLNSALNEVLNFHTTLDAITGASNAFATSLTTLKAQFATAEQAFRDLGATAEQTAQLQQYEQQQLNTLVQQASSQYLSTFGTSAQQIAAAQKQISDTLTPLGYGNVTTVAQYTSLVNATDALASPDLYGALMGLVDAFSTLKDASDQAAQAAAAQAAANKAAKAQALSGAQNDLAQAYQRESSALKDTISAAEGAITTLTTFRDTLVGAGQAGANVNQLLAKVIAVGSLAASGDVTAAGQLPDAAQNYLSAAKASAHSYTEYQRAVATVLGYTDRAINGADAAKDTAQKQLDAMTQQVGLLIDINQTALTVKDAIDRLNALLSPHGSAGGGGTEQDTNQQDKQARQDRHQRNLEDWLAKLEQYGAKTNEAMTQMLRHWKNLSPDGVSINVRGDPDAPVYTDVAP